MYEWEKDLRIQDDTEGSQKVQKLVQYKKHMKGVNKRIGQPINEHQVALVSNSMMELHNLVRKKAEKRRENLKKEKNKTKLLHWWCAQV